MLPRETDVVLKCGCITSDYGAIIVLGEHHEIQACEKHNGWFRIIRKAEEYERFEFFILGRQKIPARKTNRTLGDVLRMSEGYPREDHTERIRYENSALF